ncbi:nitrate- and nitrite sensing domain-containing protein [Micromonospora sp. H33]|uniref:sensor histidine kinase n=1 Tax=Micromonospora sp. H33 TaxID=3452215 RepID=UPI003F8B41FB
MGSRSTNLRTKVIALLASLVALWSFAAWVTVRDGFNLLGVQMRNTGVFEPVDPVLIELQSERRMSLVYLGRPEAGQKQELEAGRERADRLVGELKSSLDDWQVRLVTDAEAEQRLDELVASLDRLPAIRSTVDDRNADRVTVMGQYGDIIESIFKIYESIGSLDDRQVAADTAALISLNRARELLAQEDALLAGALAAGRLTAAEQAQFTQLVGAQRFTARRTTAELPAADRARYEQMVQSEAYQRLTDLEDRVTRSRNPEARPPVTAEAWQSATQPALQQVRDVVLAGGEDVVSRATPVAIGVIVRLVLATGLGLLAVIASIVVSITTARALLAQLERLREAAFRLAHERLPGVVERLGRGEDVDVAAEAPPLEFGDDEIGQVGAAFNTVQETAIRTAVEQAELRRNVREVFLSLARRTQALVHRQLTLLDAMERREQDAEELEDLFRVDHLATRMRRNAENLIVLSGATPGRAWRRNVPMVDVVRGAVAEVEDYTRVTVLPLGAVSLAGRAVGDVIHLLAELIENGLSFSPPHTIVEVRGQVVANGFVLEIEDRGLGMTEEDLAAANQRIVDRSELNLANASRLGLYVVSRLTDRHGVRVQLKESAYGGTTAVVLIPAELVTADEDPSTSGGFLAGTAGTVGVPALPAAGAIEERPAAAAPVALAEQPAPPRPRPAPDADEPTDGSLPVRSRGRALAEATAEGLPTRSGNRSGALDGPTVPTGLPLTIGTRPDGDGGAAGSPSPTAASPAQTSSTPAVESSAGPNGAAESPTEPHRTTAPTPDAQPDPTYTESGLPVRVRQASIAPELRDEPDDADPTDTVRPPEQVRRMMSSYQTGTRRGRTDAARLLGADDPPDADPDPGDQQAT